MNNDIDGLIADKDYNKLNTLVAIQLGYTVREHTHSFLGHLYALYTPHNEIVITSTDSKMLWLSVPEYSQDLALAHGLLEGVLQDMAHQVVISSGFRDRQLMYSVFISCGGFAVTNYIHPSLPLAIVGSYLKYHEGKQNG